MNEEIRAEIESVAIGLRQAAYYQNGCDFLIVYAEKLEKIIGMEGPAWDREEAIKAREERIKERIGGK